MQLVISLEKEKIRLPIATSEILQGLIYHALRIDKEYSTKVHQGGLSSSNRSFKAFTFGELKGKYEIEGKEIIYLSAVSLEVRSEDTYLIQLLFKYFSNNKIVKLGYNEVKVVFVELKNEVVFDDTIQIRTLSPITVYATDESGHTIYFSPHESEFYSAVVGNVCRKWQGYYGTDEGFAFSITPATSKFIKRATRYKKNIYYGVAWQIFVRRFSKSVEFFI